MFSRPTATFPLGLEQDGKLLRGALLTHGKGQAVIERLFTAPLEIVEPVEACTLAPLLTLHPPLPRDRQRRALHITAIPTEQILIRPLELKLKKAKDIDAVLAFQAEPLIPYPVENAIIDRWILGTVEDTTTISVVSVRKDYLQEHIAFFDSIKLEPEVVSCAPAGLAAFAKHVAGTSEPTFVVHLARKTVSCCLVEDGKALAAHSIPGGAEALLEATRGLSKEQIAQIDFAKMTREAGDAIVSAMETLRQSLVRTVFALTKQSRGKEIKSVLLTGEGATLGNLAAHIAQLFKKDLVVLPKGNNLAHSEEEILTFALPIGLAYTALPLAASLDQINLRQNDFSYPNPWRRLKKPMAIYLTGALSLALAILMVGGVVHSNQEHHIKEEYLNLLKVTGKSYRSFELEMAGKTPTSELLAPPPAIPLKNLTPAEIEARLNTLQTQLESAPDIFPLQPDIPKVSDVLAWISAHPKATRVDPKTEEKTPLIQIDSFNYSMTKRPDKAKPKERYQVKVDMDFTSPDGKSAREFYDALVEPNEIVDPRSEVTWSAGQGKYRISFFLRDKTVYP